MCAKFRISGVPVTDNDGRLVGIITNRDMRFEVDMSRPVREVMTPMPLVTAPVGVSAEAALGLLRKHKIEKLPLVDADGKLRGLITVKDFVKTEQYPHATKDADGRLLCGAAVGVGEESYKRAMALVDAGIDVIVTQVGDRYVLEEMLRSAAVLGGEQSGHLIFREHATTGDGLLTGLRQQAGHQTVGQLLKSLMHLRFELGKRRRIATEFLRPRV